MPTYTNTRAGFTQVGDITFSPSEVKTLYNYIDLTQTNGEYITLTSDVPYYNPIVESQKVTGTDADVEVTVNIKSSSIRIIYVSGTVNMFINSTSNTPSMIIKESITVDNRKKIIKLIFRFTGAGEVIVQENA